MNLGPMSRSRTGGTELLVRDHKRCAGHIYYNLASRIFLGKANLDRNSLNLAELEFRGTVAHYDMTRDEIKSKGMVLTVADEVLLSFKAENILFRVWFKVEKALSTIT